MTVSAANFARSMLPPDTTATILPRPARPLSAAATAQPAAPSAMTRARSATRRIAWAASSSETTIEPASGRSSGHMLSSTDLPPAPSTNDAVQPSKNSGRPAASDAASGEAVSGSAAKICVLRPQRRRHRGDAGQQSAAAERRDDRVDVGQVFEDLQRDGAVPGDEAVVVERVHEEAASCAASRGRPRSASIRRSWRARSRRQAVRWRGSWCRAPCP